MALGIGDHIEEIVLDATSIAGYNVILGLLWLWKHNPAVDWKEIKVIFASEHYRRYYRKAPDQAEALVDHESPEPPGRPVHQLGVAQEQKPEEADAQALQMQIPVEYRDLYEVFQEPPPTKALPPHQL